VRSKFDTVAKLARTRAPILIVHWVRDPALAFDLGEEVYRLAHEPKFFLRIEGDCHEGASLIAAAEYCARLLVFLAQLKAAA